tara:strand:+ start:325 stop:780 length:456 start_codon:yes stop_codon:yes gene_type:complete
MQTFNYSKIQVLNTVAVAVPTGRPSLSSLVYQIPAKPLNILGANCSPDLFTRRFENFLGMTISYFVDPKGNRFLTIKEVAALTGRKANTVWTFFNGNDGMLKVGYRPKGTGGRPMKSKHGVSHVNQNLIPYLNAMTYIRTRPEVNNKKKGK